MNPAPASLRRGPLAALLLAALAGCVAEPPAPPPAAASPAAQAAVVTVRLIAFNDFHGFLLPPLAGQTRLTLPGGQPQPVPLGGAAYLGSAIAALRAQNPRNVVVAAGDLYGASPLDSALFRDEPSIDALNRMGLEFSSVGNHEFDRGREELLRMQRGGCAPEGPRGKAGSEAGRTRSCADGPFTGAKFQYLAANVIDEASGQPLLPATGIKTFDTPGGPLRIGFIGLVLKDTSALVSAEGLHGLRFADEADTANALVPKLKADGADTIVVLIHQGGYVTDTAFDGCAGFTGPIVDLVARLDSAIRTVVSAHTHHTYNCRLPGGNPAQPVLVTSAGNYGRYLTRIDLDFDAGTHRLLAGRAANLPVINDIAPNPVADRYPAYAAQADIAALAGAAHERAKPEAQRVVAHVAADLDKEVDAAGEMPLGEVIADAQLEAMPEGQLAFMNPGGVRNPIAARPEGVTYEQVFSAQPFGSDMVALTLTGAQIHTLLEAQWTGRKKGYLLLPSRGFGYRWSESAPEGAKVDKASIRLNGRPLQARRRYRVVVNDFLANGGDLFPTFLEGTDRKRLFRSDCQVTIDYLRRHQPVAPPKTGRIVRVD